MEKTREGLCILINKVDICLKGNVISNEEVLKIEEQFLTEAYKDGREHKTLFIQHTGSDYYDAIAFAIAVLSLIFMDETKAIDVTKDIEEGDIVTFRSKRWIYSGTTVIDGVEEAVTVLKEIPTIGKVTFDKNKITASLNGNEAEAAEVLRTLINRNIKVTSFNKSEGNLEELFIKLTENVES